MPTLTVQREQTIFATIDYVEVNPRLIDTPADPAAVYAVWEDHEGTIEVNETAPQEYKEFAVLCHFLRSGGGLEFMGKLLPKMKELETTTNLDWDARIEAAMLIDVYERAMFEDGKTFAQARLKMDWIAQMRREMHQFLVRHDLCDSEKATRELLGQVYNVCPNSNELKQACMCNSCI
jgi:hypothetical protein